MKICSISLGLTMVVARAKEAQCTVGNVAMAPFEREYGNGHSLIIIRSLRPSCFSVSANAAKRLSFAIRRWTTFFRRLRERINETVLPTMVALAAMNQPFGKPYTKPAIVNSDEYPINGGNETMNINIQRISQPAVISRHFFASGASTPKMRSLYIRKRIPRTTAITVPRPTSIRCNGDSSLYVFMARFCILSAFFNNRALRLSVCEE